VAEQDVNEPSAPPAGTDSEKVMLLPLMLPDTVPVAFVPLPLSVSARLPENEVPDWVSDQVMRPLPDESVAVPDHVPFTVAGVLAGGAEGVVGVALPPPLQPAAASSAPTANPATTRGKRATIMMESRGF
jgi:hypothetical protein